MKILLLCESFHSATKNIAMKLAKKLNEDNDIYVGYFLSYGEREIDSLGGFKDEFIIQQGAESEDYSLLKERNGNRIFYFLLHPLFFIRYFLNHIGIKNDVALWSMTKRVDKYCSTHGIEAVIGVSEPYFLQKIVSGLKSVKNRNCLQLDPYSYYYSTFNYAEDEHNRRLSEEIEVFKRINRLYTTDLIKKELIKNDVFMEEQERIVEIHFPLVDQDKSPHSSDEKKIIERNDGEVVFLHAGSFYPDIRNPRHLVDLFEKLPDNYVLYTAGFNSKLIRDYDIKIRDRVRDLGVLSPDDIAIAKEEADFLVSFNNTAADHIPSKLFECINEGKPFLNLCQIEDCPTLKYVDGYDLAFTMFTFDMEKRIQEFIEFTENSKGKKADRDYIVKRYYYCTIESFSECIINGIHEGCQVN